MKLPHHIDHTVTQIWVLTTSPLPPNIAHTDATWFADENDALAALANCGPEASLWTTTIHATQSISEWQHVTPASPDAPPAP
ncbi:hypothetical protein V3M68_03380 [Trueperella pyogenes]|uniref:hypothetical protein n=1 Tax=Trueperella pyogenes TaxID=1661 RepID=UPI00345CCDC6